MNILELQKLVDLNAVNHIIIFDAWKECLVDKKKEIGYSWRICAYDHENSKTVESYGNALTNTSRTKEIKQYSSLSRAFEVVKKLGFKGNIFIDG